MIKKLLTLILFLALFACKLFGQAPKISYASPQAYTNGTAISPLSPVNTGGAMPPVILYGNYGYPGGIALDAAGNVYVADYGANDVKEIPVEGGSNVTLGSGFNHPMGVAVDGSGNVYVTDYNNNAIKMIPAGNGTVVTVASGINHPYGIALDGYGYMYVAEYTGNDVIKIPVGGGTPVVIGTGFNSPTGVAVDASGNVYVADRGNNAIKEIKASDGSIITVATAKGSPDGVAVDEAGNLYFSDSQNTVISEIPAGGGNIISISSGLSAPSSVATDIHGDIYAGDGNLEIIKEIGPAGTFSINPVLPSGLSFDPATGIISGTPTAPSPATDYTVTATNASGSGTATINITVNQMPPPVISYPASETFTAFSSITPIRPASSGNIPSSGAYSITPALPRDLIFDVNTGIITGVPTITSPATNYTIGATNAGGTGTATITIDVKNPPPPAISYSTPQVYTKRMGNYISYVNNTGGAVPELYVSSIPGTFNGPDGLGVDAAGNIYVSEAYGNVVKKILAGSGTAVVIASGFSPAGLAVDPSGNVYVADRHHNVIKKIPADGSSIVTIAAGLNAPNSVALDGHGYMYVAEYPANGNGDVKKIPINGGAFTILGTFSFPSGVAVDSNDNVYVVTLNQPSLFEIRASDGKVIYIKDLPDETTGITIDAANNIYLAANFNNKHITEIPPSGIAEVRTVDLESLDCITTDNNGNLLVGDASQLKLKWLRKGGGYSISPALPTGLTLNNDVGFISGDPTVSSPATDYTITATNTGGTSTAVVNITVNSGLNVSYPTPLSIKEGFQFSQAPTYTADPTVFSISPALPAGLTFNQSTGVISGIPSTTSPPKDYTIVAHDGADSVSTVVNIQVVPSIAGLANLTTSQGVLSPAFSASVTKYSINVASNITSLDLTPTADSTSRIISINGVPVSSGSPYTITLAAAGSVTYIAVKVFNSANQGIGYYAVAIHRAVSSDANLSSIKIGTGALSPAFAPGTTSYSVTVGNTVTTEQVVPKTDLANETIKVNGTSVSSGATVSVPLNVGANTISIVVTAQDGTTTKTYTITATRATSNDATLSNLALSAGTLAPAFASATTSYSASVSNTTSSITVTPTSNNTTATIKVNGATVASGSASGAIPLSAGSNTISVVVTASNNVTIKTYTITVTRATSNDATLANLVMSSGTLSPAFSSGTLNYNDLVQNPVSSITITPTANNNTATIKVNGAAVASGTASAAIPLNVGNNTVTITVLASDGVSTKTYTVTVQRLKSAVDVLAGITLSKGTLSPSFAALTTGYTATVGNSVSSITVTPTAGQADETIKINGMTVASGTASAAIPLTVGANTISIAATSQSGLNTKTYTVTVTRSTPSNATLSNLAISSGTLSPAFATGTLTYSAQVQNPVSSITVTPTSTNSTDVIQVNGNTVASGSASPALPLNVGSNAISIVVTELDGTTTKTYTVNVQRLKSAVDTLANIQLSSGTLTPKFYTLTTSYTASVSNATSSITVTPTAGQSGETINVNGTATASGTASAPIALSVGSNTITIAATSQNGLNTKTYTVTVNRSSGGADAFVDNISVSKPSEIVTLADEGIKVHEGISPNGDGVNDFLVIDNISQYPDNKLSVMNRNGQLIFEAKGYDNTSKVFDGRSNKTGQLQQPGTYFYQLDYTVNGIVKHKTGFIVLKY